LAESLGCRKESKDGAVGLMISQVYSDSPAEEADLRTGDVLLWLEAPERGHPVLLTPPRLGGGFAGGDNAFAGQGSNRAPWPSRGNFLTGLLATIGENTSIMIKYWRDGGVHELATAIRQAPPDQDSAAQFKDEGLGITVKEVTYEVRAALRLKPNDPGVIVAKVESGSPASRARINPFELVQAADGEPIASPAQFEEIVKKAQDDKSDQIRLTIVDRGRSRFADLKLSQ
jgi:S1-C subfamily serine protease